MPPIVFSALIVPYPLGHHAATCKRGGDAVLRHNKLRDILVESFHQAHIHVQVEAGSGLSHDHSNSRPADILVFDWDHGKPAALDLTVVSPLNANILKEAGATAGAAAQAAEARKHTTNDQKCSELGWSCVPLAIITYFCIPCNVVINPLNTRCVSYCTVMHGIERSDNQMVNNHIMNY